MKKFFDQQFPLYHQEKTFSSFGLQSAYQASVEYFRLVRHLKTNERQFAAQLNFSHLLENDLKIMQTEIEYIHV